MIIDEKVEVKIGSKNFNHYKDLNYEFEYGNIIKVEPRDLTTNSRSIVNVKCDVCGKIKKLIYQAYSKNIKKYPIYCCSTSCSKEKENLTKKEIYGDNYEKIRVSMMKKTNLERYGNENSSLVFRNEKNENIFIKELIEMYGEKKFNFSKIKYINNYTKVEVICEKHGSFLIKPSSFLSGTGCVECNKENSNLEKLQNYINRAKIIHNNKYDYSNIKLYETQDKKVEINCPDHGFFKQSLKNHVDGKNNCPKCAQNYSDKDWIKIYKEKHNNYYDYSETLYINSKTKIKILCPVHGYFYQLPSGHASGSGCIKCSHIKSRNRRIEQISNDKFYGNQMFPSYNKRGCELFDKISKENNSKIKHAMNGGEYYIGELGYWVDGYDEENNIVYEYDEKSHFKNGELRKRDIDREKEIKNFLKCEFIRFKV